MLVPIVALARRKSGRRKVDGSGPTRHDDASDREATPRREPRAESATLTGMRPAKKAPLQAAGAADGIVASANRGFLQEVDAALAQKSC